MLALVAMLLCATHANAQQVTYQGVVYQILNTTDCAIVGLASSNKDATELVFNGDGIPDGGDSYSRKITQVNIQAFDSKSLKKVDMSKLTELRKFDHNCFRNCKDLTEVILPEGLTNLGVSTFDGCSSLAEITLPSTLKTIGSYDFKGTAIKELTIPSSVTYVGREIFGFWDNLQRVNMENPVPPTGFDNEAFYEALHRRPELVLFVPSEEAVADYKANEWWGSRFTNIKCDDLGDEFNYGHFRYRLNEYAGTRYVEIIGVADDNGLEYDWMLDMDGVQYDGRIYPVWYITTESCQDYRWEELDLNRNMFKELKSIGVRAFYGNTTIKSVKLPDYVWWIGESAFAWCSNLEELQLPYHLQQIDYEAFRRCTSLKAVEFHPGIKKIKERAFDECWALQGVILPNSLEEVGYRAFAESGLEWIVLPPDVAMGWESLLSCNKLKYVFPMYSDPTATTSAKNIFFMKDNPGKLDATVFVPTGKLSAYQSSDWGSVFSDIRDNTEGMVYDNDTITMRLDEDIQWQLGYGGIPQCSLYPAKASITGMSENCPTGDIELKGYADWYMKGMKFLGPFLIAPTKIAPRAFKDNKKLTHIDLSEMYYYLEIGYQAFAGCSNLRSIGKDGYETCAISIGDEAFMGSGIEKIEYYSETATIGNKAFANCPKLKEVIYYNYSSSTTNVGNGAFENCPALEWLELGREMTFGYDAFANCTGLKRVTSFDNTPSPFDESVFSGVEKQSVPLFVPPGTVDTYKATDGWKDFFGNNIKDTNAGELIDDGVFTYEIYDDGTSVDYDGNVAMITGLSADISTKKAVLNKSFISMDGRDYTIEAINNNAFMNLVFVDEMDFSAAEHSIEVGYQAFYNAKSLKHVKFNEKAGWTMGYQSFAGATNLEDIVITNDVQPSAFSGCTKLQDVGFTSGCTVIGDYAFADCTGLKSLTLPKSDELTIYNNAFENSGLQSLNIPSYSSFYIHEDAFNGSQLTNVVSYIDWPGELHSDAFNGIPAEATLSVPYGTQYIYEYTTGWDHFYGHITEREWVATDVQTVETSAPNAQQPSAIYDMQGVRQNDLKKGLNIIRQADGTTRKVVMK